MLSFPVVIYFIILYNIIRVVLQEIGILLGVLSDCEELVGVTHRGMMGLVFLSYSRNPTPFRLSAVGEVTLSQVVPLSVDLKMFPELPTATNVLFPKVTA